MSKSKGKIINGIFCFWDNIDPETIAMYNGYEHEGLVLFEKIAKFKIKEPKAMSEENKYPISGYAPGNYQRHCCQCGTKFIGDKRAVECEPCAINDQAKFEALSPDEQMELVKRNAEIFNSFFNKKQ